MESEEFESMHELAGVFVLGALSDDEYDAYSRHLSACDDCQTEVSNLQRGAGALSVLDEQSPVSDDLMDRLMALPDQLSDPAGVDPRPVHDAGRSESRSRAALFALAAALAVIAGSIAVLGRTGTSPTAELAAASDLATVALTNLADNAPPAQLAESAALGRVGFIDQDFVPLDGEDEIYVLWKLVDGGAEFVGFVRDPDQQEVDQTWDVDTTDADGFAVSIETVATEPAGPSERIVYASSPN